MYTRNPAAHAIHCFTRECGLASGRGRAPAKIRGNFPETRVHPVDYISSFSVAPFGCVFVCIFVNVSCRLSQNKVQLANVEQCIVLLHCIETQLWRLPRSGFEDQYIHTGLSIVYMLYPVNKDTKQSNYYGWKRGFAKSNFTDTVGLMTYHSDIDDGGAIDLSFYF